MIRAINAPLACCSAPVRDGRGPVGLSASLEVDQTQLNRLFINLIRIGETHGGARGLYA
jgi:hypothetical protein